jgi:hypothetical protein
MGRIFMNKTIRNLVDNGNGGTQTNNDNPLVSALVIFMSRQVVLDDLSNERH